jgi:L-aminopeptidase/D-esterase-like protein
MSSVNPSPNTCVRPSKLVGFKIGHAHDPDGLTGCTVLLFDQPGVAASQISGSAPATFDFSNLDPIHRRPRVDAIFLTGGSSFGLPAAAGVQAYLEGQKRGFDVGVTNVPIVSGAAIFDLAVGDYKCRPTPEMAHKACINAKSSYPDQGSVGVGMGATVGKFFGTRQAMRGGFGVSSCLTAAGSELWALAAVNSFGDVWSPGRTRILAGARSKPEGLDFADAGSLIKQGWRRIGFSSAAKTLPPDSTGPGQNTTLVAVVTNAALDAVEAKKLAFASLMGLTDVIYPACTLYDGDLAIAVSTGSNQDDLTSLCMLAQHITSEAIINAVTEAQSTDGIPAYRDLRKDHPVQP